MKTIGIQVQSNQLLMLVIENGAEIDRISTTFDDLETFFQKYLDHKEHSKLLFLKDNKMEIENLFNLGIQQNLIDQSDLKKLADISTDWQSGLQDFIEDKWIFGPETFQFKELGLLLAAYCYNLDKTRIYFN